jgi:hypothetical protein
VRVKVLGPVGCGDEEVVEDMLVKAGCIFAEEDLGRGRVRYVAWGWGREGSGCDEEA